MLWRGGGCGWRGDEVGRKSGVSSADRQCGLAVWREVLTLSLPTILKVDHLRSGQRGVACLTASMVKSARCEAVVADPDAAYQLVCLLFAHPRWCEEAWQGLNAAVLRLGLI